jgi:hypothetical protein
MFKVKKMAFAKSILNEFENRLYAQSIFAGRFSVFVWFLEKSANNIDN